VIFVVVVVVVLRTLFSVSLLSLFCEDVY